MIMYVPVTFSTLTTTSDNNFSAASSAVSILLGVELKASESSGFLPPKGHQDELFRSRLESEDWPSATLSALSFSGVGVDLPEKQTNMYITSWNCVKVKKN